MPTDIDDRAIRIRSLNDAFRQTFTGGHVLTTQGVLKLDQASYVTLLDRVRRLRVDPPPAWDGVWRLTEK